MNKFEKITKQQFDIDFKEENKNRESAGLEPIKYEDIKLPKRATTGSAGYDIFSPCDICLAAGETAKIPTGIKVHLDDNKYLEIVPRSGLGFKYRLQLDNTVGIIDSDYINSDNEGHIWAKITNDSRENKMVTIKKGEAFSQGIVHQFFKMDDDDTYGVRNGGFGSTGK